MKKKRRKLAREFGSMGFVGAGDAEGGPKGLAF
jgi:hypothetical protein